MLSTTLQIDRGISKFFREDRTFYPSFLTPVGIEEIRCLADKFTPPIIYTYQSGYNLRKILGILAI
jgi:hypothetical protein